MDAPKSDAPKSDCERKHTMIVVAPVAGPLAAKYPRRQNALCTFAMVLGVCLSVGLIGCTSVGPTSLSQGRPAYNAVLAETSAEQALAYVVRMRYGESASLLSVASINATVSP